MHPRMLVAATELIDTLREVAAKTNSLEVAAELLTDFQFPIEELIPCRK